MRQHPTQRPERENEAKLRVPSLCEDRGTPTGRGGTAARGRDLDGHGQKAALEDADTLLVPSTEVTGQGMVLKFLTLRGGGGRLPVWGRRNPESVSPWAGQAGAGA